MQAALMIDLGTALQFHLENIIGNMPEKRPFMKLLYIAISTR